ncbi:putative bifunctional diguanylate cyclase/phosphodiesterase [Methylobacterium sp. A54F]
MVESRSVGCGELRESSPKYIISIARPRPLPRGVHGPFLLAPQYRIRNAPVSGKDSSSMGRIRDVLNLFVVPPGMPDMHVAQLQALSKQAPLFYGVLWLNAALVIATHVDLAPPVLTYGALIPLTACAGLRGIHYYRLARRPITPDMAFDQLRTLTRVVGLLIVGSAIWCLLLARYGGVYEQMHVLFFATYSIIASIFGLMHIRAAALRAATAVVPIALYFLFQDNGVLRIVAVAFLVLSGAMVYMALIYHEVFSARILQHLELQRLNAENMRLANADLLTGLPNRRSFFASLDAVLAAGGNGGTVHLALIDLDGFKPVNDTHGHPAGDAVLRAIGERLQVFDGQGCFPARVGGDEFAVIIEGPRSDADVLALGQRIRTALSEPIVYRGFCLRVSATLGIARAADAESDATRLVENADCALYHGKLAEKGSVTLFSPQHEGHLRRRLLIEQALRQADLERELRLVYQPIVDLDRSRIVMFEALARWDSPALGAVTPGEFIPIAEKAGLIPALSAVLFAKALSDARHWPADVHLAFNLSAHDLTAPATVERLSDLIEASGMSPGRITFEVTETALIDDFAKASETLHALRTIGACLALDDFGTGFSSLSYLHRLPIDKIKIDRSFVAETVSKPACREIVRSVVALCRSLGLGCLAEGIETEEQAILMRGLGCSTMQGYYFERPIPPEAVIDCLAAQGTWRDPDLEAAA